MNILSLLDRLSATAAHPTAARRTWLARLGRHGLQLAAAALPVALGAPQAAQGRPSDTALDAALVLLKLEELQVAFYTQAAAAAALAAYRADVQVLLAHQQGHRTFLRQLLTQAGVTLPATPNFDFSGQRGNASNPVLFADVFTTAAGFLSLGQQIEDASTAIYKSQAPLFNDKPTQIALLRMQLVEARQAARLRTLRRTLLGSTGRVKSWPSRADTAPDAVVPVPSSTATTPPTTTSIYFFENNENQSASSVQPIPFATLLVGTNLVQANALAEAFDEPLPGTQASAFLDIFG